MTSNQAIGLILFSPAVLCLIIGGLFNWAVTTIRAKAQAKAKAQAIKEYNDSLFFIDINGECNYYETH